MLNATPFYDTDVVAVTNATAKKYGLKSIGDLKKVGAFKFGGFPECQTRNTCFVGYKKQYGLTNATFVPIGTISPYAALDQGKVLAADVFSTDPPLGKRLEVHRSRRPEARHRLPERRPDREDLCRACGRRDVHEHGQRRLGEAEAGRDRGDEQGVLRRQAVAGRSRRRS